MHDSELNRRELLKLAALATGGMASLHPDVFGQSADATKAKNTKGNAENAGSALDRPPEVATLYSKEYGRRRMQKIQAAIRRANLDALVVTNRGLDYIGYVSNFHPYPLEPGLALVLADGPSTLFVNTYSVAHTRALIPIVRTDELVDIPRDSVSEGSNQNLVDACIQRLQDRKLSSGRIGLAGDEIDWLLPFYFRDRLPNAKTVDANHTLTEVIVVKDEVEIALIRAAQRIIDEVAFPSFRQELRPGAIDQVAYAHVLAGMLEGRRKCGNGAAVRCGPSRFGHVGEWNSRTPVGKKRHHPL